MAESSGRMLPQISESTEFFWKSGEDGTLRFQRCSSCGELRHPPSRGVPRTATRPSGRRPRCRARGVVAGFTINEQTWIPSFPPPYVIAIVAIEEDDRVRLTTNIVNCDPTDVYVGMKVQVLFEHDDDVWIPLFEPTGDPEKGPFPADDPTIHDARPMPRDANKFEDNVAVTGIGMSRVGRRLMVDPIELTVEAAEQRDRRRRADARRHRRPLDVPGAGDRRRACRKAASPRSRRSLRLRPSWINSGLELPGQAGSVIAAMLAVAGGLCNHVLCFRTVWEATYAAAGARGVRAARRAT